MKLCSWWGYTCTVQMCIFTGHSDLNFLREQLELWPKYTFSCNLCETSWAWMTEKVFNHISFWQWMFNVTQIRQLFIDYVYQIITDYHNLNELIMPPKLILAKNSSCCFILYQSCNQSFGHCCNIYLSCLPRYTKISLNKRPMGHIAHLRKQFKSLFHNVDLEKKKKHY